MSIKPIKSTRSGSARDRLLAAAEQLFYDEGVHTVGIDRVIERAGVAKASLYATFGSKDELIRAYLQARQATRRAQITARLASLDTPRAKLLAIFELLGESAAQPRFRGCAFVRASAEASADSGVKPVCDESRAWMRGLLTGLAGECGVRQPDRLARQLHLLYDGATVGAQMDGDTAAPALAQSTAAVLLDVALAAVSGEPVLTASGF